MALVALAIRSGLPVHYWETHEVEAQVALELLDAEHHEMNKH